MKTEKIVLSGSFFKDVKSLIKLLLSIFILSQMLFWGISFDKHSQYLGRYVNILEYLQSILGVVLLPEICTIYILKTLIFQYIKLVHKQTIELNFKSIVGYQLSFIPLFIGAFAVFFPVTIHVRFFIVTFPYFSWVRYSGYMTNSIGWNMYFLYLPLTFLAGYVIVNIALARDLGLLFFPDKDKKEATPDETKEVATGAQKVVALPLVDITQSQPVVVAAPKPVYLSVIECRNNQGTAMLKVEDAFFFETDDELYYMEHPNGRYRIGQKLVELNTSLDPVKFFRINRRYIINLRYLKAYSYWEKGKYLVKLDTPNGLEISMPRARYQDLKHQAEIYLSNVK